VDNAEQLAAKCEARAAELRRQADERKPKLLAYRHLLREALHWEFHAATLRNGGGCPLCHMRYSGEPSGDDATPCPRCHGTGLSDAVRELAAKAGL
jgi:hypothetical protein